MTVELDKEAQRRVLEMVTAACNDIRHGGGDSPLLDDLLAQSADGPSLLRYQAATVSVALPEGRRQLEALVDEVAQNVFAQVAVQAYSAIGYAIMVFSSLALEVERNCPGVSIDSFPDQAGRALATDDGVTGT